MTAVPGQHAPFPSTWTPTLSPEVTPTATLVVVPTPTWDGTPPPPSEDYVPRIAANKLYRALNNREPVTVVDVRTKAAFDQVHVPGALHIPLVEIEDRVGELDGNHTIVFYCISPNRAMSLSAAMTLYQAGFTKIAVLEGGLQSWYSAGYPIEGELLTPTLAVAPPGTVTPLAPLFPTATLKPQATDTPIGQATITVTLTVTKTQ